MLVWSQIGRGGVFRGIKDQWYLLSEKGSWGRMELLLFFPMVFLLGTTTGKQ